MRKPCIGEIFQEIEKEKVKNKKIKLLQKYDSQTLRGICELAYDARLTWALPEGRPPFTPLEKSFDAQGHLYSEMRRMYLYLKGGNDNLKPARRETIFINTLEELDPDDAEILLQCKERKIKGCTKKLIQEAYPGFLAEAENK
jgi:ribosomal protein L20A (L18A)